MRKTTLMAMGIVTALVSVADVDGSAEWTSAPMALDIESGVRNGAEGGDFTYDTLWFGVTNADYRILVNGVPLSTGSGAGTVAWRPQTVGDFVVTYQAFVDGMKVGDDLTASFRIAGKDLAGATIMLGTDEAVYDGTPQTPPVKVVYQSETLVEGVDYTLDYENNVMPGVATVVIRGRGRFSDAVGKSFSIRPSGISFLDLESGTRTADPVEPLAYDTAWFGDVADACGIFVDGRKLMSGTGVGTYDWASRVVGDHVLQYRSYIGDYLEDDSYRATFHVAGRDLVNATVTVNEKTIRYDGTAHTPTLTLELNGKTLVPGVDYVLSYADNVNPGIGVITVTGLGSYVDILNVPFTIMPAGICFLDIESGTRQAKNVEPLYYDGAWNGNETGAVRMKLLSQKSDAAGPTRLADNLSGTGHYDFTPDQEGVYTVSLNTYVDGFLSPEVYTATFNFSELVKPIPQDKVTVTGYVGAYDGAGHSIAVTVDPSIAGATVRYGLTREGAFGDKPLFTNVCAATTVWCEVSAAGYLPVTNSASVTITPRTVANPFDPDDPSAPPSPGALARADCTAVYDGEGHSISVAPLLSPALAADGATVTYSPDPSRVPFAPEGPVFTNAVSTCVWYRVASPNYAPFTTNALLEIRPRPVTLTSKSAAKAYDGTPLTAHGVAVGGDGFVDGEGTTYSFTGSQTVVGTGENTFTYTLNEKTAACNYEITIVNGTLTVTKATIGGDDGDDEPGDGEVPDGGLSKFDVTAMYDGAGHTIATNALVEAFVAAMGGESAVEYAAGGSQFTATVSDAMNCVPPCFTNAGEYVVWYRVTNPNYEDFVHAAKVTVTKRPVTLTSGTKLDFVYDGQPHAFPHFIKSGQDFVEGEGFVASNWATVTRVDEGEVANTFDYTAQEGTDLENYVVTVVTGKIAVVKATVGPGGGSEPGDGEVPDGGLSKFDTTAMYDGAGHTIDTNALVAAFDAAMIGENVVEYAAGGSQFTATVPDAMNCVPPCFTNAGEYVVWYRVTNPNYEDFVHAAKVTVTKRPVTLTSGTKLDFVYDGQPHACPHFIKSGQGFVAGEGVTASNWATVTRVDEGEVANTFDYAAQEGTDLANYETTIVTGKIAVVAAPIPVGPDGVITTVGYTNVYDGAVHGVAVLANGLLTTPTIQYRADEADAWADASPMFSNVCDTQVWYLVSAPNYAPVVGSVGIRITPRPVTLTSRSATKVYDGTPLTVHEVTVGGDGFADGEGATYSFTGTQTTVGTSENTFTYALNEKTAAGNYEITTENGTLTVTKASIGGGEGGGDEPGSGDVPDGGLSKFDTVAMYDGEGHTIDTNALVAAFGAAMVGESAVEYAAGGSQFTAAVSDAMNCVPPCFTNAGEYVVWYRVTNPNYEDFVHAAKVIITKRPVTFTSGTKLDFVYDGQPHACPHFIKSGHDFVDGEGIVASDWATVTCVDEGEVANTFDYAAQEGTDLANYETTIVTGKIAVVAAPIPVGPSGAIAAVGYTNVYDGAAHGIAVSVDGLLTTPTVQYRAGETEDWGDTSPTFSAVCGTQVWYRISAPNYAPVVGTVGIRITPRPVMLTSKSSTKVYDGTPLTAHEVTVGGDGFVDGEGATYAFTGSQTAVGTSENTFTYALNKKTAAGNYAITTVNGTLTVTKASIGGDEGGGDEPGGGEIPDGGVSKFDVAAVYDGAGHTVDTNGILGAFAAGSTCMYARAPDGRSTLREQEGTLGELRAAGTRGVVGNAATLLAPGEVELGDTEWSEVPPVYTNAGEYVVWYRVTNPNYEDFVHQAKVTITKRPVTLTSGTKLDFVYNGQPHACPHFIKSGQDFVAGEGIVASNWATVTRVDEGEVANTFDYTWCEGTYAENYALMVVTGRIAVVRATYDMTNVAWDYAGPFTYDGTAKCVVLKGLPEGVTATYVDNEKTAAGTYVAKATLAYDTVNYHAPAVVANCVWEITKAPVGPGGGAEPGAGEVPDGGLSKFDTTAMYDGAGHTIDTNALVEAFAAAMGGGKTRVNYGYAAAGAAATGQEQVADWRKVAPVYTNAGEYVVWYRVTNPNYEDFVHAAKVTIAKRSVTLTSGTKLDFVYDGQPHAFPHFIKSGQGFVAGEGVTASNWATVTRVDEGEVANTFDYVAQKGTDLANYAIIVVTGRIAVVKATVGPGGGAEPGDGVIPDGWLSKFDTTAMYDGVGHTVDTNALVEAFAAVMGGGEMRIDYGYAAAGAAATEQEQNADWREIAPVYTNAGEYVVWYRVTNPNYADFVHAAKVTIARRRVTLRSADGTWTYDGAAHSNATVTVSGDGFVPREGMACGGFATIVDEGTCPNSFNSAFHAGTLAGNYEVATVFGTLTVTAAPPCHVILDALGGRVGSAVAATQAVRTAYGALPEATRSGYRFAGWFLGVTNGAPGAVAGGDVLASGDHVLFAKWICDPEAVPDPEAVYTWEAVDADTARITGLRNPKQRLSRMVLPDRIGGRFVTEIAAGAFANTACGVEELWLPVFCTKVGDRAFLGIPSLQAITFAEARRWEDPPVHAAVSIGRYAFSGATSLTRLVLVEEIASLGDYAFLNTRNLASVTILGRPTLGRDVFRSCGVDVGGVTVRLDPALADDAAYREALTSRMTVAKVRTDAVVAGLRITAFELLGTGTARLGVSVERAADWGVVDADTLLVRSGRTLPEMGNAARPLSAVWNGDGTLTLEVAAPDGGGGFFQVVIKDE